MERKMRATSIPHGPGEGVRRDKEKRNMFDTCQKSRQSLNRAEYRDKVLGC